LAYIAFDRVTGSDRAFDRSVGFRGKGEAEDTQSENAKGKGAEEHGELGFARAEVTCRLFVQRRGEKKDG
jgi:hypothetical protein